MDNNKNNDPNGQKSNWQTITMLAVAALLTFVLVTGMQGLVSSSRDEELSYSEFVRMVENGEVEAIVQGSSSTSNIQVIPKAGTLDFSSQLNYYVVPLAADAVRLSQSLLENGVDIRVESRDNSVILAAVLNYAIPFLFLVFLMK